MQCSQCQEREAVVHLTQIADNQVVTVHLCERCAAEKGVESASNLGKTPIGSFLATMGQGLGTQVASPKEGERVSCEACGATLNDFRETGRLGCGECYRTFAGPLRDLLRRLHGSSRHLGERYSSPGQARSFSRSELDLREQLRLAIQAEDFELAAELRDRLREGT